MTDLRDRFPDLSQLLGCYLHQDWKLEFPTADAALAAALQESSSDRKAAALAELHDSAPADEAAARSLVNGLCDYHPPDDGRSYLAWLRLLEEQLADEPQ